VLSYGPYMEVISPDFLREEIRAKINLAALLYGDKP
jgi:predicted DNA-binding transcriptional regulator YafY